MLSVRRKERTARIAMRWGGKGGRRIGRAIKSQRTDVEMITGREKERTKGNTIKRSATSVDVKDEIRKIIENLIIIQ